MVASARADDHVALGHESPVCEVIKARKQLTARQIAGREQNGSKQLPKVISADGGSAGGGRPPARD